MWSAFVNLLNDGLIWASAYGFGGVLGFVFFVTCGIPLILALICAKLGKVTGKWR